MRYKGYLGVSEVDAEAGVIHGRVAGLRDVITFEGTSVAEARKAFQESVDDYLDWCASEGRTPEKPFNGKLLIRVSPTLHRSVAQLAEARSISVNALVSEALRNLVTEDLAGSQPPGPCSRSRVCYDRDRV